MRILCTFPGRAGDLLWALPTVRAIAEATGDPVDLQIAGEFAGMAALLEAQPYLGRVWPDDRWSLSVDWQAPRLAVDHDQVIHLGYRRWPKQPLPREIYGQFQASLSAPLDLTRPWIQITGAAAPAQIAVGFTEAWFELKLGLLISVDQQLGSSRLSFLQLTPPGSRWTSSEVPPGTIAVQATDWLEAAGIIRNADIFFGDCSALHVLAVAQGKPCVLVEPMEARHNPIFYPYGQDGPQVTLVKGLDGQPTFDARHAADALRRVYCHG